MLPEVGSTMVPPRWRSPSDSAARIMRMPMRSLTELPGLNISSLASRVGFSPRLRLCRRTMGVLPISSSTLL